jgi:hypothetical protein
VAICPEPRVPPARPATHPRPLRRERRARRPPHSLLRSADRGSPDLPAPSCRRRTRRGRRERGPPSARLQDESLWRRPRRKGARWTKTRSWRNRWRSVRRPAGCSRRQLSRRARRPWQAPDHTWSWIRPPGWERRAGCVTRNACHHAYSSRPDEDPRGSQLAPQEPHFQSRISGRSSP